MQSERQSIRSKNQTLPREEIKQKEKKIQKIKDANEKTNKYTRAAFRIMQQYDLEWTEDEDYEGDWYVALEGDTVVGGCIVEEKNGQMWMYDLAVLPSKKRQGIGRRLVNRVLKDHGQIHLTSTADGQMFYRKLIDEGKNIVLHN